MIEPSARPLNRSRLHQLVRGLRQRSNSSAREMAEEIEAIRGRLQGQQEAFQGAEKSEKAEFASRRDAHTTQWDESLCSGWDKAEASVYNEVTGALSRTVTLEKTAKSNRQIAETEAKRRNDESEKAFVDGCKTPQATAAKLNQHAASGERMLDQIADSATNALVQRSLPVPKLAECEAQQVSFTSSGDALRALKATIDAAKEHCRRITHQPLARFVDSPFFWLMGLLLFGGLAAGLVSSGTLQLMQGMIAGGAAAAGFLIFGLLAVRPWLKRVSRTELPQLHQANIDGKFIAGQCRELVASEKAEAIGKLAAVKDKKLEQVRAWKAERLDEIDTELKTSLKRVQQRLEKEKSRWSVDLGAYLDKTNDRFQLEQTKKKAEAKQALQDLRTLQQEREQQAESDIHSLQEGGVNRLKRATQKAVTIATNCRSFYSENFAEWATLESDESWPAPLTHPILPLGTVEVRPVEIEGSSDQADLSPVQTPLLFSPLADKYLTILAEPSQATTVDFLRSLILRYFTNLPAGKAEACVIDPPGLGQDFGWLMHLADFDPQLVSHRVWTQTQHIARQTTNLARGAEDFIQQALRNEYRDISEYNQHAGALSEPYRLLVWSSFPEGIDDQSLRALQSLLDTGARCGVIPVFVIDPQNAWLKTPEGDKFLQKGLRVRYDGDDQSWVSVDGQESVAFTPEPAVNESQAQKIVSHVGRRALKGSRVEVPLAKMVPERLDWWQGDSSSSLEIPVGQSGVGRTHSVKLGIGTAQHAIIAGKTGSGKSSLLHALITSALVKYSPERLRLVLLDFKKGVEFQVYSEAEIPHADIIGIESQREFGLSTLEYIDDCLSRRGEAYRQAGVQDLPSWNRLKPDDQMPRMLLVIDEFQELFVEDDKLAQQASLILDRIVRQGRSFGVHAVLSSQTLAGSYALPRTTLGQMAVRIALQCDVADANIIFTDDNPAAARLKHPGQAVYNDEGGRIEGNQPMQIGWLDKAEQKQWLATIESGYRNQDASTNTLGRTVVFDGNRAATWDTENAELAIARGIKEDNPDATWCVVGESVAISPAVSFPFTRQPGRNAMMVGSSDAQAASTLTSLVASWARQAAQDVQAESTASLGKVVVVQGARPVDKFAVQLPEIWKQVAADLEVFDSRGAVEAVTNVHLELKQRIENDEGESPSARQPLLFTLLQIGRLRELKSDDEFSFGETSLTPDKMLEEILRDGPALGIHTVIWSDSASTVGRWLSRSILREIEIRLLMQMSANDSTNLIESVSANRLGEQLMLAFDDATGIEKKYRPFRTDDLIAIANWTS